jgi:hypothetical protein
MKNLNLAQARISPANSLAEAGGAEEEKKSVWLGCHETFLKH